MIRHRYQIYKDILDILKEGPEAPTRLMYASRISWQPMIKHVDFLVEKECVKRVDSTRSTIARKKVLLHITVKGREDPGIFSSILVNSTLLLSESSILFS